MSKGSILCQKWGGGVSFIVDRPVSGMQRSTCDSFYN